MRDFYFDMRVDRGAPWLVDERAVRVEVAEEIDAARVARRASPAVRRVLHPSSKDLAHHNQLYRDIL